MVAAATVMVSCKKSDVSQPSLILQQPAGWPLPAQNIFFNNSPTEAGFQLGRKLFYDGRLSIDGNFPCSSCHMKNAAFGTFDHDRSHGYNHSHTLRNAPGLFNLAWMREFNWNGEYKDIPSRILAHITDLTEMAGNLEAIINKLQQDSTYPVMFMKAFGKKALSNRVITADRIAKALTQFVGLMVSANTRYDQVKKGFTTFSAFEQEGYDIFKSRCVSCHQEPLFTDYSYRNNGLAVDPFLNDKGRLFVTHSASDSLKFRVPTLRNNAFTYPYMHDGRLYTLDQVIEHYSSGVINGPTTDTSLLNKPTLTIPEKARLLQFLRALNDTSFMNDPRY